MNIEISSTYELVKNSLNNIITNIENNQEIDVFDLDFDGCTSGITDIVNRIVKNFSQYQPKKLSLQKKFNDNFWNFIKSQNNNNKRIVICGSARQDQISNKYNADYFNKHYKQFYNHFPDIKPKNFGETCAFTQLRKIANDPRMNAEYWPILFADEEIGSAETNHDLTIQKKSTIFDDTKIVLLKYQIDKLKTRFPKQKINIKFLDDRIDILNAIKKNIIPTLDKLVSIELYKLDWNEFVMDEIEKPIELI